MYFHYASSTKYRKAISTGDVVGGKKCVRCGASFELTSFEASQLQDKCRKCRRKVKERTGSGNNKEKEGRLT